MRTQEEIYQEMVAHFASDVGFTPNETCDLAVRLHSVAAEMEALYAQADWVLAQSFPQLAQGEYLDYHAAMRALTRSGAACAQGRIRFGIRTAAGDDIPVAAGTVCMSEDGTRFVTLESVVLAAGELWVEASACAVEEGAAGNAAKETVCAMVPAPAGIVYCINPEAFAGGCDAESDESLRARILASYRRLPNGANAAYYEQAAEGCEGVAAAKAVARARGIGTVDVYIATYAGVPSQTLLNEVQQRLESSREIAVDVSVCAPTASEMNVSVSIAAADGYAFDEVSARVETAVRTYFTGERLGSGVTLAELGRRIYSTEGVSNYRILSPTSDVVAVATALPMLKTLSISEMA